MLMKIAAFLLLIPALSFSFDYHYLNTTEKLTESRQLLLDQGLNKRLIKVWAKKVNQENKNLPSVEAAEWLECTNASSFDFIKRNSGREYINCRLGLFMLIRDQLIIDKFKRNYKVPAHIKKELNGAASYYKPRLSEKEIQIYKSLFQPCRILKYKEDLDLFDYTLSQYKKWWVKEGLRFPENSKLKILQMVIINRKHRSSFSDHVALMIQKEGYYYLIEKISPVEPFMISRFKTTEELGEYMSQKFLKWKDDGLMILANDVILWKKMVE